MKSQETIWTTAPYPEYNATYIVKNAKGQVAPMINGIIHNNVGTPWDWDFCEPITGWCEMPKP